MVEQILQKTSEAKAILKEIRKMPQSEKNRESLKPLLKKAVCCKLMIPEDETDDIKKLIVLSIKRQNKADALLPDEVIQSKVEKYDCHQSSLVLQKKTLLTFFIERELGLHWTDDEAVQIASLDDLCSAVLRSDPVGEST